MHASDYLVAHSDKKKGAVVVSMKPSSGWITIIGATCPVGRAGNSFYVSPERGKEGIIIVSVTQVEGGKHGRVLHHDFILPLGWFLGSPEVDLDTDWVPRADRLPTIWEHSDLEVAYEGKPFTTSEYRAKNEGKILIERTLLCQFVNGDVEVGALLAVANERLAEQRATEKLADAEKTIAQLQGAISRLNQELFKSDHKYFDSMEALTNLRAVAADLHKTVSDQIYKSQSVRRALNDTWRLLTGPEPE